jgi:hypothetical protein
MCLGATLAQPAVAQGTVALDPNITDVVTGGTWHSSSGEGLLRVVVLTRGFDHLVSELYVQWLLPAAGGAEQRVLQTRRVDAIADGVWTLRTPRLRRSVGLWQVIVEGTNTHTAPPVRRRWIVAVGAPGEVSVSDR